MVSRLAHRLAILSFEKEVIVEREIYCAYCGEKTERKLVEGKVRRYCPNCHHIFYENPIPAVAIAVLDEQGRILLVKRGIEPGLGKWSLPGGYIELGESPEEAAIRELKEETKLKGSGLEIIGVYNQENPFYGYVLLIGYLVKEIKGNPSPSDDAASIGYFFIDELPDVAFWSHKRIIEEIDNRRKNGNYNRTN